MAYLKLLLMRHAQSQGNAQRQMEGQSSTALSTVGWRQAHCLSDRLIEDLAIEDPSGWPTHLYSSPLLRATQTADVLTAALTQAQHSFSIQPAEALQEMHQGIFQGLTWSEAQAQHPQLCAQLLSSLRWQPVPQAETLAAARARSHRWIQHLLSVHSPGDVVWMVSHTGILQQLVAVIMGCDRTWKIPIAHTAIFEFWLSAALLEGDSQVLTTEAASPLPPTDRFNPEYWQLRRFNDHSHLTGELSV